MDKIAKAQKQKEKIAKLYNIDTSKIVWMGKNSFIVVKLDRTIIIKL